MCEGVAGFYIQKAWWSKAKNFEVRCQENHFCSKSNGLHIHASSSLLDHERFQPSAISHDFDNSKTKKISKFSPHLQYGVGAPPFENAQQRSGKQW